MSYMRASKLLWRLWSLAALATLLLCAPGGLFAYYYLSEAVGPRVVCLMYHRLCTSSEFQKCRGDDRYYAIPGERFEEHLRYLREHDYRTPGIEECVEFMRGRRELPDRSVLLTLDDGCVSALTRAQPLLRKYGFRATLFVTADPHSRVFEQGQLPQRRLTDDELRQLDPAVIDVQAHGLTHRQLASLPDDQLVTELVGSRNRLERVLGRPIRYMAVPGNAYDQRVLETAQRAGYDAVFTSDPGSLEPGDELLGAPRVNVAGYFGRDAIASLLDPEVMARRCFIRELSHGARVLLGATAGPPAARFLGDLFAGPARPREVAVVGLICLVGVGAVPVWRRSRNLIFARTSFA